MTLKRLVLTFLVSLIPFSAHPQQATIQNPQAVALTTQAMAALTGTTQVNDVTLTGTANLTVGPDTDSGRVTLKALGTTDSRLDLTFSDGTRSEIRISTDGAPNGSWIGFDGLIHPMSRQNQITDATWFFTPLTVISETSNPNVEVNYIGSETKNGVAAQHIQFKTHFTGVSANVDSFLSTLSTTDVYLDATSFLPIAVCFNAHPNNDAYKNIAIEIDFSDYRPVNGVQVPFHIQKFFNGPLYLDLTIQNAVLNSGLTSSAFSTN